jgi:hypothetical protein
MIRHEGCSLARLAGRLVLAALVPLLSPRLATAEERSEAPAASFESSVQRAARAGSFLPLTLAPNVGPATALAAGYGGYDGAKEAGRLESFAEVRVYGPFAFRFGVRSEDVSERVSPSATARVQLLSLANHGIDGGVSLAYKAEGFNELEGEIELAVAVARSFGRLRLLGNVAYGQDPEGNERDGELRTAALYSLGSRYHLGLDGRARFALGAEHEASEEHEEPRFDLDVGPVLVLAVGPLSLGVHGGLSAIARGEDPARFGFIALAGLGTAL